MKRSRTSIRLCFMLLALSVCLSLAMPETAVAAGKKLKAKTVTVKIGGKQRKNGDMITLKKGAKVNITATTNPKKAKKSVQVKGQKKLLAIKGSKVTAKKTGKCTLTVKVKDKTGKTKTMKFKVVVIDKNHKHVWKNHTTTKKVWVPCLVDKGEYVDAEKWFCDCGYDDWIENTTEHQQLHEGLFDNHIEVRRRCVVVGKVDMGDWWDKKVVDYQYCDCGARR